METLRPGYTLLDLLVTLTIAVTLVTLGVPRFDAFIERERRTAAMNQIIGAVQFARAAAIQYRARVVLCPAPASQRSTVDPELRQALGCGARDDWHLGALIFIDENRNGDHDPAEPLLRQLPGWFDGSRVRWRAFRARRFLEFQPRGFTDWQNGSFTWCPEAGQKLPPAQVVLNVAGRVRWARDEDGDGIPENSRGDPVTC